MLPRVLGNIHKGVQATEGQWKDGKTGKRQIISTPIPLWRTEQPSRKRTESQWTDMERWPFCSGKKQFEDNLYPAILFPLHKNMSELKSQIKCFCVHRKMFCRMLFKIMITD